VAFWVLSPLTLGIAYLMVSTVRYPKDRMKAMVLHPRSAFRWLFGVALIIAAIHYAIMESFSLVLFPAAMLYVGYGLYDYGAHRVRRMRASLAREEEAAADPARSESTSES
jgi:phosphatidylserine synthase